MTKITAKKKEREISSYEEAIAELENLIFQMESGDLSLEASLLAYKRGTALTQFCQKSLSTIDAQIKVLDGDGKLKKLDNI